jgi:hypothetical protein
MPLRRVRHAARGGELRQNLAPPAAATLPPCALRGRCAVRSLVARAVCGASEASAAEAEVCAA